MKQVYRVLAYAVAALVAVQAAAVAYGFFALGKYVDGGGTIDKATESFPGSGGLEVHGTVGVMVIPAVALVLLIISFFAKLTGGVRWALIVFFTTVVQVGLGLLAHDVAALGILHGIFALILFGVAVTAAMRVRTSSRTDATSRTTASV